MKLIKKYKISENGELIFARTDLKNFFKNRDFIHRDFFLLAVMELGTNILKYAEKGEIWFLECCNSFGLAALDRGKGIKNVEWALKRGTSTGGSLGLGLHQLSQNENFILEIFTSESKPQGTVVLLRPKSDNNVCYLIDNYLDLPYGGDFVFSKGKYLVVGDVSGHGRIANKTADKIKEFFLNRVFSCLLIDETLKELHSYLIKNNLRSVVMSVIEITKKELNVCGVGNLNLFLKKGDKVEFLTFQDGVVGEVFSKTSKFNFKDYDYFFITSDGISEKIMYNILNKSKNFYVSVVAGLYFAGVKDDKTILGVKNGI